MKFENEVKILTLPSPYIEPYMVIGTSRWGGFRWNYTLGLKVGTNHGDVFVGTGTTMFGEPKKVFGIVSRLGQIQGHHNHIKCFVGSFNVYSLLLNL